VRHATIIDGQPVAVLGPVYLHDEVQYDLRAISGCPRENKLAIGLYEIERQPPPENLRVTGHRLEVGDGVVLEVPEGEIITPEEQLTAERAGMAVSRFQAKAALLGAGLLDQVNTALADADPVAQLAWAEAVEFRRTSPTILGLAATIGLTGEQLDDLFRAAAGIEA
jgi:hypothetical protein